MLKPGQDPPTEQSLLEADAQRQAPWDQLQHASAAPFCRRMAGTWTLGKDSSASSHSISCKATVGLALCQCMPGAMEGVTADVPPQPSTEQGLLWTLSSHLDAFFLFPP